MMSAPHPTPSPTGRRPRRLLGAAVALSASALVLAACSTGVEEASAQSTSAVPASVIDAVAAGQAPVTEWPGPDEEIAPAEGLRVTILSCGSAASGCVLASDAAREAAVELGWDARIVDGRLDPSAWNAAARQAATDGQDALILVATNPALMQDGLAQAEAAGITTVLTFQPQVEGSPELGAYISTDHAAGGTLLGQSIIADSGGEASVLVLDAPEYPEAAIRNDALVAELEAECPGCTVTRQDFSAATMVERLAGQVSSLLQQDPTITHVFTPFDATGSFVSQGIRQAGRTDSVQLVAAEGAADAFDRILAAEQATTLAGSPEYVGWLAVDTVARLRDGATFPEVIGVPQRLLVEDNIADTAEAGSWQMEVDFRSAFRELWGR